MADNDAIIGRMSDDELARWISKHLMMVEAGLDEMCERITAMREDDDTEDLARGYLATLRGMHQIRAGHMELTDADFLVFKRPIPLSR